jgi:phosphate transport system protein
MQQSTVKAVQTAILMLEINCDDELKDLINDIIIEESKTDDLYEIVEKNLVIEASKSDNFEKFHTMLKALRKSGKIADRAASIGNLILYINLGGEFHTK